VSVAEVDEVDDGGGDAEVQYHNNSCCAVQRLNASGNGRWAHSTACRGT